MPEYDGKYHNKFYEDYETILFIDFTERVLSLKGTIGDIISLRSRYLNNSKMTKEEKFAAMDILTPAQKEWELKRRNKNNFESAIQMFDNMESTIMKNRERRLKEKAQREGENGNRKG